MPRDLAAPPVPLTEHRPLRVYDIRGAEGVKLRAREWGRRDGPAILFVHGWSQCDMCWAAQVGSALAERFRLVTFDLRGHGMSEKLLDPLRYADERLWADDLAAVVDYTGLECPVVVAWSYGGFVVADYLRAYGDEAIGAINLVGAAVVLGPPSFEHIGPGFLDNALDASSPELSINIAAVQRFLHACTAKPLSPEQWTSALCWNMVVPPLVRGALISREIDDRDVYSQLSVPVLVTHGTADTIVLPSMAELVLECCESAVASWYDGTGHMPFVEAPERFNLELAAFVDRAQR